MSKTIKPIPKFNSYDEEVEFWDTHDMTDYMVEYKGPVSFPNLKPSTKSISIRLPQGVIDEAKMEANKRDIPYQSLLKQIIFDGLHQLKKNHRPVH